MWVIGEKHYAYPSAHERAGSYMASLIVNEGKRAMPCLLPDPDLPFVPFLLLDNGAYSLSLTVTDHAYAKV